METQSRIDADPQVSQALDALAPAGPVDVVAAWRRQQALQAQRRPAPPGLWTSARAVLSRPNARFYMPAAAVVVLALATVLTPAGSFAAQVLTIFRVQDVTPITVDSLSQPVPDLSQLGDMSPSPREVRMQPTQVTSLAAAASQVGFNVLTPSQLPAGLANPPSVIAVTNGMTANFTFRAQKARAYLDSTGHKDVSLPPKFDGATLTLRVSPGASLAYLPAGTSLASLKEAASSEKAGGKPNAAVINTLLNGSGVMIMEAKSPELDASGVSADELRDFLLSLPSIPETTRAQLRSIGDWRNTLPVPAAPGSNLHKVSVNGAPGVAGRNGSAEMLLWVRNGIIYVATGPKVDEKALLTMAASM